MSRTSRRDFLRASICGAGLWGTASAKAIPVSHAQRRAQESYATSSRTAGKLNVGIIGCGGKGASDAAAMAGENVIALCDVDWVRGARTAKRFPKARRYHDFRVMLEKEPWLDAVTVSTPDHTHAVAALMAMDRGLHVYCQKPLTHSVEEARLLRVKARRQRVVTSMGNQGTAMEGVRRAAEIVRAGVLGEVKEVHVWTDRPNNYWPQGLQRPEEVQAIPAHFRWDLWLGPRAYRPYHKAYGHFVWRGWWDYGTGALGDMACHTMNMAYLALELGAPLSVEAEQEGCTAVSGPKWSKLHYHYAARGKMPAVDLTWYDGGALPAKDLFPEQLLGKDAQVHPYGTLMIGSKATLYSPEHYGRAFILWPSSGYDPRAWDAKAQTFQGKPLPEPSLPRSPGIHQEWLLACKDAGPEPMASFDYAGPLTEAVLLGNVAIRANHKIEWDAGALRVTNHEAANAFVRDEYSYGFELPA